jgi:hypothetical protein
MRRFALIAALMAASLASPVAAQDGTSSSSSSCLSQMAAMVGPLLQQASAISPQGMGSAGFVPLTQPFAPPFYGVGYPYPGAYPAPPTLAPPTAAYNASAWFTGQAGFPPPSPLNSTQIAGFLAAGGKLDLANPTSANANPTLIIALANLQQTEQARQQQQALLQQQQGLYLNSLYQLSSSYQVTATDWLQAFTSLAQAYMSYFRDLCAEGGPGLAGLPTGVQNGMTQAQTPPGYAAGYVPAAPQYPMVPGAQPYPGVPGVPWR